MIELIQDSVWAILPAKLEEIHAFIDSRLAGFDPPEIAVGKSGNRAGDAYDIVDGVAVIPVYGTLMKRANLFTQTSGGTSYQLLRRDIAQAVDDPAVRAILLDFDSPGGTVDGVTATADLIVSARNAKPVHAFAEGLVTSAAQWLASAASETTVGPETMAGSIGVVMTHYDRSAADALKGVKRTEITAGRYKRMGTDAEPLNDEARAYLQSQADTYYGLFLDAVARNRGVDAEQALAMADGRLFIGQQAVDVGLVDRVGSRQQALERAARANPKPSRKGVYAMTAETIKQEHPEAYRDIFNAGAASVDAAAITAEATKTERSRVVEILAKGADYPETARKAVEEGMSVEACGWAFLEAEKTAKAQAAKLVVEEQPLSAGGSGTAKGTAGAEDFMVEVARKEAETRCTRTAAIAAVAGEKPELHRAWLEARNRR